MWNAQKKIDYTLEKHYFPPSGNTFHGRYGQLLKLRGRNIVFLHSQTQLHKPNLFGTAALGLFRFSFILSVFFLLSTPVTNDLFPQSLCTIEQD